MLLGSSRPYPWLILEENGRDDDDDEILLLVIADIPEYCRGPHNTNVFETPGLSKSQHLTSSICLLHTSSCTKCVTKIIEFGFTFKLYIGFNLDLSNRYWFDRAFLQTSPAMDINITFQPSSVATTSTLSDVTLFTIVTRVLYIVPAITQGTVDYIPAHI